MTSPPPPPTHILETILYVRSMPQALHFYTTVLNLKCLHSNPRNAVFALGAGMLLLFQLGLIGEDVPMTTSSSSGTIPRHGPTEPLLPYLITPSEGGGVVGSAGEGLTIGGEKLRQHFCFAVNSAADVELWDAHLRARGVGILGRVQWPDGRGRSVYFADPDGNVGEVASKGIWRHLTG